MLSAMKTKTILITGGESGVGAATARALAAQGHRVLFTCREAEDGAQLCNDITTAFPRAMVKSYSLDLASFSSIRLLADKLQREYNQIDVLINNASLAPLTKQKTRDGFELQFGANYLGHFLFTQLLLDVLNEAGRARIVHTSSMMHWLGGIDFGSFHGGKFYDPIRAYAQSKLAILLFSNELSRRLKKTKITSNTFHPGGTPQEIYFNLPRAAYLTVKPFLAAPEEGARTAVLLATAPHLSDSTGKYFSKGEQALMSPRARNEDLALKLYEVSAGLCQVEAL
jgi:NAD(P)-dependent dehydrogenase (short-subunit alcohol dehydrogenase family)